MKNPVSLPNFVADFFPKGWYSPKKETPCKWSVQGTYKNLHGTIGRFEGKSEAQAMAQLLNKNGGFCVPKKIV